LFDLLVCFCRLSTERVFQLIFLGVIDQILDSLYVLLSLHKVHVIVQHLLSANGGAKAICRASLTGFGDGIETLEATHSVILSVSEGVEGASEVLAVTVADSDCETALIRIVLGGEA
jgi:hypothetical protein